DRISQNAYDTAMIPSINQWWATAQLPWGIVVLGSRDFAWGTGAVLGINTRNDSLLGVFPYGPFRIIPQIWLAYTNLPLNGFGAFTPYGPQPGNALDPASNHTGPLPNTVVSLDRGNQMPIFWSIVATYENGPVNLGFGFAHFLSHYSQASLGGPGLRPVWTNENVLNATPTAIYSYGGMDQAVVAWTAYLKYNNGGYFANLEYWFANVDNFYTGVGTTLPTGAQYSGAPPLYIEASMAYAEIGALCGPAKVSGLWAWSGGSSLNNNNPTKVYTGIPINYCATDAYNYLMFKNYAGGNDAPWGGGVTFTSDDYGMMLDAWCLAARLDYAIAANLNVWGSYMWANRVEQNGWLAGQKDYNGNPAIGQLGGQGLPWTAADAVAWKNQSMPGAGGNMNPYVDSCYLGWEADCGVDWKLLENMMVSTRYAYWQPGTWFNQAYQVVGVGNTGANNAGGAATTAYPTSGTPGPGIMGGYLQGRSAIQSFTTSVFIDF
ncbi:MAG: hypothetical protein ACP5VS_16260, partial [Desulfomonilaceae bacterium]